MQVLKPPYFASLEKNDPVFAEAIEKVMMSAMVPGALDYKTKLLLALVLDAAYGSTGGVANVSEELKAIGTSNEEIAEALRVAYFAFSNPILTASTAAFKNE
ncbi:carboxymuconolactone decarboxylase family protein [Desulfosporosinus sp. Sb-LF]|uniref:carboxymuconolactone decarboxylase family protein n=1 Tax=Desulfosporosinus sp. Sb-LF TaxID=2560027 RepID=UPI00107FB9BC|nr:carboxymuconolactone decarboxylase family protein [Desulfosporosinus sp. Sb-LF]TGE34340.1 carboxymuconolactone decarboxylase family protein [Desulfosporosinus sp. Sb-LF]